MKKKRLALTLVLILSGIAWRSAIASGLVERFSMGRGRLIGSVAYPDGGAVDVIIYGEMNVRFAAVSASGQYPELMDVGICMDTERIIVTASGRAVHLATEGPSCGVEHWRYWIPDEMTGLQGRYEFFIPLVTGG